MTAQDYCKLVIQSTLQDDDDEDDGYTYGVSWLRLVKVHVDSKKIKGSYPYIFAETLFNLFFLPRITFLYGFLLLKQNQWIRIIHFSYNFEAYLNSLFSL